MKITSCNDARNFGMLMGKKEITNHLNGDKTKTTTVQYLYPFKDEFKSAVELDWALTQFKRSSYFIEENTPNYADGLAREYKIAVGKTLPFTRTEFVNTLRNPGAYNSSKEAANFINSRSYNTTYIKTTGLLPGKLVEQGNIEYII